MSGPIDLTNCRLVETVHLNGGREWFGYVYRCVEHPRLQRMDRYTRADRSVTSTWRVDGQDVADLDAAKAALALAPVITADEEAVLAMIGDEPVDLRRTVNIAHLSALADKGMIQVRAGKATRLSQEAGR